MKIENITYVTVPICIENKKCHVECPFLNYEPVEHLVKDLKKCILYGETLSDDKRRCKACIDGEK